MNTYKYLLLFSLQLCPTLCEPMECRPPCPSPSPEVCPSSCPLHQWCHPAISCSDALFSICPQSFLASRTLVLSHVWLFVILWTLACRFLCPWDFSGKKEYWSGLSFPPPGDLPDPGIESVSLASPVLAGRFFTTEPPGKPNLCDIMAHSDSLHATDFLRELNCTFTILTNQPLISLLETNF